MEGQILYSIYVMREREREREREVEGFPDAKTCGDITVFITFAVYVLRAK